MKLNKKILTLLIAAGISFSIVGCNSSADNKNNESEANDAVILNESEANNDTNDTTEESTKETVISEKEAIKIAEEYVHELVPKAKLKVIDKGYLDDSEFYILKYDTKFFTSPQFTVDVNTGEVKATLYSDSSYVSIEEWLEKSSDKLSDEMYSSDEAKNRFLYSMSFEDGEHYREDLSDYQKDNIELVEDYLVEVECTSFYWVFRYPMETSQEMTEKGYSETNAYDKNDKYGYFYINPRMNWVIFKFNGWPAEELAEVGSLDN